ncbi:MAG TPA: TylF/MycF/NovP-related O-methyltransferase [Acidimicrobiales bacterium]|nr:TylF/MycF/NovP-related O-methyltransferase [Acidimicrobiales bacterium]
MSRLPDHALPSLDARMELSRAYLTLCKEHLTRGRYAELEFRQTGPLRTLYAGINTFLSRFGLSLLRHVDDRARLEGHQSSSEAETMVGRKRLDNLEDCVRHIVQDGIPGDLIETGVWRGGSSIFMRAALLACGDSTRTVWAADSFQGLPKPNADRYPADSGDHLWDVPGLAVSLDQVKANFARYGLLDDQVRFLPGWFSDTLPNAPIQQLALLRLDGDMYESTKVALESLYPKLSVGGYVIVDDYGAITACQQAVADFRNEHGVEEPIHRIDWTGVYWRREA